MGFIRWPLLIVPHEGSSRLACQTYETLLAIEVACRHQKGPLRIWRPGRLVLFAYRRARVNQHDAASPAIDGPWIEIRGGRTRFPRRPITGDRLLIGSGSNCHLQLGGGMPMAHSVISRGPEGWLIEALVAEPRLIVRGEATRKATLQDGDVVQLGPFTIVAHLMAVMQNDLLAPLDVQALVTSEDAAADFVSGLSEMSADDLVDGLATELTSAVIADHGFAGVAKIVREAVAAEPQAIDEERLIAEVMAQLAEMAAELSARGIAIDGTDAAVLPLAPRDEDASEAAPLRKSA